MHRAYRVVVDAVTGLPVRALVTIGPATPRDAIGEIPANVHVESFLPHEDILPRTAAVICHGGSGTVVACLGAGVPMVVLPMFSDQPMNAERVAATGAGIALHFESASPELVRAALSRVLNEPAFRGRAQQFAREIAESAPIADSALELERVACT
jgi:MGT family glycosyltransferase